jgi:hypothetical protein
MRNQPDRLRRALLGQGLTGLALFVAASGASVPAGAFLLRRRELPADRSIFRVRGQVLVDGEAADKSTRILAASVIETGRKSEVVFRVGADAFLLRENSRLALSATAGDTVIQGLHLLTGALLSVFGPRPAAQPVTMKTPTAVLGIRGTGLYVESAPDETYVCTCYGTVELAVSDDPHQIETVTTRHHESPRRILAADAAGLVAGTAGQRILSAGMKNHRDAELELIEAIVGRKPSFPPQRDTGGYGY